MKKAILLIAVLLLVGSALFADASFGIWGRTRFAFAEGNQTLTLAQTYQDWGLWGNSGPQMQFNYSWSNDKMGYVFKIVANGSGLGTAYDFTGGNGIAKAYGTLKLVPGLLTLHIGFMQDYDQFRFEGGANIATFNTLNVGRYNGWGLIVVLAPKDSGFVVAAQWRTELGNTSIVDANLSNASIAAEFQVPDVFKVQAGLVRNGNKPWTGAPYNTTQMETYPFIQPDSEFGAYNAFLRLHLLAVQGLTLNVTGTLAGMLENDIGFPNVYNRDTLYARFGVGAFAVALGAEAVLMIPKTSGANSTFDLGIYVEPSYNLGPITLGLGAKLDLPTSYSVGVSPTDALKIQIEPWVLINDFSTRIFFDYIINPNRVAAQNAFSWDLKADVTFSF
jgi:hypothetical protein